MDISVELERVVLKCLEKDPTERYASPLDLLNALELALPAGTPDAAGESFEDAETFIAISPSVSDLPKETELLKAQDVPDEEPPANEKPRRGGLALILIGLGLLAIVVGTGVFAMSSGGNGSLAMLAANTDTPMVTASPLPTETPEDTAMPAPTKTASYSPSPTWSLTATETATLEPSQTPTDTVTSHPTDTPTLEITLTPSLLPEGYAIVPDVSGLDFYTAGLRLQEAGFEVDKVAEYNPSFPKNEVFRQEPTAGSVLQISDIVKIISASDVKELLIGQITGGNSIDEISTVQLPNNTWCQFSITNISSEEEQHAWVFGKVKGPEGDQIVSYMHDFPSTEIYREFTTTTSGIYTIEADYHLVYAVYQLICKPPYTQTTSYSTDPSANPTDAKNGSSTQIPEGYAVVPDVVGLDFYTAGIRLQEVGLNVEKLTEYNSGKTPDVVSKQEPEAGSVLSESETVTIIINTDVVVMLSNHVTPDELTEQPQYLFSVELPGDTWCQHDVRNLAYGIIWSHIRSPSGEWIWGNGSFTTAEEGTYQVSAYTSRIEEAGEGDIVIVCKP